MYPCAAVPYAVTVLYVFAVINLTALLNISLVEASVRVLNKKNETLVEVDDIEASFGPDVPEDGIQGHLMYTNPKNACAPVERVPPEFRESIALIERNNCNFTDKVINAQRAGYRAAIVHNLNSDILIPMHGSGRTHIPSVFIGFHSAQLILQMLNVSDNCTVIILPNMSYIDVLVYFIPFAVVVALSFLTMLVIMAVKWYRDYRVKRRNRLSKTNLKKLPIKKFKKGDPYDVCAICLEEYEEGDKLRILPCTHGYHQKCVDPWLTKNRKLCPICKRKIRGGESDSSSDDDNHQPNQRNNERTPLLNNVTVRAPSQRDNEQTPLLNSTAVQTSENSASNQQDLQDGNAPQRGWDVFVNSIRRELPHATPSSEDYSSSQYASSVEVHEAHSAGCMADNPLIVAHMLPSHMLASDPLKNKPEEPLPGAVGDDSLFNNDTDTSELLASSRDGNDDRAEAEVKLKNKGKGNKKKTRKNHSPENV